MNKPVDKCVWEFNIYGCFGSSCGGIRFSIEIPNDKICPHCKKEIEVKG